MSVRRAWRRVAEETAAAAGNVQAAERAAQGLQQAAGTIAGGGGAGGLGPSFQASSIAPMGQGGAPAGGSLRIGGGGEKAGDGGDKAAGIESVETNRDKIGAIIDASGVAPPPREAWDENGVGPGEFPGLIFRTVLALGTSAPTPYLVWCAGWLVYSSAATTKRLGSTPSRKGPLGPSGRTRAEQLRAYIDANFPEWGGAEAPMGFSGGGGGGGGGGGSWADQAFNNFGGGGSWEGGGSWTGGSNFDELTASTGKAVTEGVSKANEPVVDGINKMVDQMSKLNATLSTAAGGVGVRAGR